MTERDRLDTVVLVAVWVVPLLAAAALLAAAGLPLVAGALLAVEACVAGAVALARRRPARDGAPHPARPWLVPLAMVLVLAAMAGLAAGAAALG